MTSRPPTPNDVLLLSVDAQPYGVFTRSVRELLPAAKLTPLPGAPRVVAGLLNLRGALLPVIDLRRRFSRRERALQVTDHFVVVHAAKRRVALWADRAEGIVPAPPGALDTTPRALPGVGFVAGALKLEDGVILIYDLERFLTEAESEALDLALAQGAAQ